VVPGDEGALAWLRRLSQEETLSRKVQSTIQTSLGPRRAHPFARDKSRLISLASELGVLVPDTRLVHDAAHLQKLLSDSAFPMVLKRDEGFGGDGVRIFHRASEGADAFAQLATATASGGETRVPAICLQSHIAGTPANRAVLCRCGEVLAGLSVEATQTLHQNGPASVIRPIDSPQMAEAATRIVKRLGLSGFAGFDFVLDAKGNAYLLELNQRPTQICHLRIDASTDMIGTLSEWLTGTRPPLKSLPLRGQEIALHPVETWRGPNSKHVRFGYHDIPHHWPEFVAIYRKPPLSRRLPFIFATAGRVRRLFLKLRLLLLPQWRRG
jgi:hypothetical protein